MGEELQEEMEGMEREREVCLRRNKALSMRERHLVEQDPTNILGVTFDFKLNFGQRIEILAHKGTHKLNALRRILHLLPPEGALQPYKSQVHSALEYSP